ncbi:unnamed protein product [Trifolium pratense]|uniref:Uncharacterized protein n=1 Tax=Trifolium pratense TaxID=57577 RepID=A0ACB0LXR3_TRIPR|nr:unnamed protein product [Trifolium pratense]
MENCSANLCGVFKKQKPQTPIMKKVVLREPTGREIGLRYELGREFIGREFGIIYFCKDRQTGEEFACESISKNKLRRAIDIEDVRREVEIMRHLPTHPNIVTLKDTYEDDDAVHLVMELCKGRNLLDRIVGRGYYTECSAASVIKTVVEVVQMCHKHGVMHRNLQLENIWFANKMETSPSKVTDFRLSIFFQPGERLNQMVGNLYYMAPEVLKRNYGPEIDIWSAGVILYCLLCGFPPFWAETAEGVAETIIRSVIDFKRVPWPTVSDNAKNLVKKMLDPDPKLRLTAQEVLDHPWLISHVNMKSDNAKDLVETMLNAHDVLGHPWLLNAKTTFNVSCGETVRAKLLQFSLMNQLTRTTSRVTKEYLSTIEGFESERMWVLDTGTTSYNIDYDELRTRLHKLDQRVPYVGAGRLNDTIDAHQHDRCFDRDYPNFVAISVHLRRISHEEHVDRSFQFFDKKRSGYIKLEELRKALAKTDEIDTDSKEVINAIVHAVTTYKDGRISYGEITNRTFELLNVGITLRDPRGCRWF